MLKNCCSLQQMYLKRTIHNYKPIDKVYGTIKCLKYLMKILIHVRDIKEIIKDLKHLIN